MSRGWLYGLTAAVCTFILGGAVIFQFLSGADQGSDLRALYGADQVDFCREVQADLQAEKFDDLDRMGRALATLKDRFVGGSEKLSRFYNFMAMDGCTSTFCVSRPVQAENIRKLQHWLNRDPRNPVAKTAMALNWYYFGWMARSCAEFADVTFDQWQGFFDRLRIARSYLATVDPHENPKYYPLMMDMLRESGASRDQIDALYEEGHRAFPDFYVLTAKYMRVVDPGWYGRQGDIAWLAETQLNDPGGDRGQVAYSFVAEESADQIAQDSYFSTTGLTWEKIKQGFATRKKLYGLNIHEWNAYCFIAFAAGDRDACREAYANYGENWDPTVWQDQKVYFDRVLPWIKGQ
jgi:hypothetical protein